MMICPYNDERLLLILQVDHSRVTGWLAAHWGNDEFARPSPYAAMVLAAQEHDTGWWDWEIKPQLNDEGRPSDYIGSIKHLGLGVWLSFYRNGITRLAEQDAYAGYIVSLHAEALLTQGKGLLSYMPDYTVHPEVREFLGEQESYREALMARLRESPEYRDWVTDEQLWDELQAHGDLRSDGAVHLQPVSLQLDLPQERPQPHAERHRRAGETRSRGHHPDLRHPGRTARRGNALPFRCRSVAGVVPGPSCSEPPL